MNVPVSLESHSEPRRLAWLSQGKGGIEVSARKRGARACICLVLAIAAATALHLSIGLATATGATPPLLAQFPEDTAKGDGAGQLRVPRATAVDPVTGDLYIVETSLTGSRVSEFTAWGEFVRALGWDVAPGAVNERQEVRFRATAGEFRLTFGAQTTPDLPFDASAGEVEAALNALPSISAGGGAVAVTASPGNQVPGKTPSFYIVTFTAGPLAATDVEPLTASNGSVPLSGGVPSAGLFVRMIANGTSGGTGLEACTSESGCKEGILGSGSGQLKQANGIAFDAAGNFYVLERVNARVQVFNPNGEFVLMFGGEVDKTTSGNVCTAASGHTCGAGVKGTGSGFFEGPNNSTGNYLAVGSDGTVYVGDRNRIEEFNSDGTYKGQIGFAALHAENSQFPEVGVPKALTLDPASGDIYFALEVNEFTFNPSVYRVDAATGHVVGTVKAEAPVKGRIEALGVDGRGDGDLFVIFDPESVASPEVEPRVMEYGPAGEELIGYSDAFASPPAVFGAGEQTALLAVVGSLADDVYVSENGPTTAAISVYGPPPLELAPPPKDPPVIVEQLVTSASATDATVKARINPRYWSDTRYYVEYGPVSCSVSSCATEPTAPGSLLTKQVVNSPVTTAGVLLGGLDPNTTYHYRFVAEGSGGGPVKGLTGKTGEEGEGTFTTSPIQGSQPPCPENQAFRAGAGSYLPDCRAYEMVSPVNKNGADISVLENTSGEPLALNQAASDGEKLTFSAYRAFGEVESSPATSQYLARREAGIGWAVKGISPKREGPSVYTQGLEGIDSQYKAFSDDLCDGWLLQDANQPLASSWTENWANLYRRDLCGSGYTTLAPLTVPTVTESGGKPEVNEYRPQVEGVSANGSKALVVSAGQLTGDAAVGVPQLYESSATGLQLVCVLPASEGGEPWADGCSAGTGNGGAPDRSATIDHAISDDGEVVWWTAAATGPAKVYVRVGGAESFPVTASAGRFWTAAAEHGSRAVVSEGATLKVFDLATKASTTVTGGFQGLLGASDDATKLYLVSTEVKAPGAIPGEWNLYLYELGEPGSFEYIGTLAAGDVSNGAQPSPFAPKPSLHSAQVTPDGGAVAFMSVARLTGYDNTDLENGEADAEVFVYRAAADQLTCVSCRPSGARSSGIRLRGGLWAAAQIPTAWNQMHFPRVISDDGKRVFFESVNQLAPRDANSAEDVYEWEATGSGNCATGVAGFNASLNGCLNLISSGEGEADSQLIDSSPDGRDVFFTTESSLLPQDPGLVDIYDARAGGGFPIQQPPPPGCVGEACQSPAPAPSDPTPSSQAYVGPGNEVEQSKPKPRKCAKGKHKVTRNGKTVCVKNNKKHRKHKRADKTRRAGR